MAALALPAAERRRLAIEGLAGASVDEMRQVFRKRHQKIVSTPWRLDIDLGDVLNNTEAVRVCKAMKLVSVITRDSVNMRIVEELDGECLTVVNGVVDAETTLIKVNIDGKEISVVFAVPYDRTARTKWMFAINNEPQNENTLKFIHSLRIKYIIDGEQRIMTVN